jgi:predicted outer membrane protein
MINIHRRRNLMLSVFSESRAPRLVASALTAVVLVACGPREGRNADSTDSMAGMDTSPAAATPATGATLSDAQISHIVMTANSGDSAMGALAVSKARNAQVKEFGRMMVRDHGDANKKVWELTQRLSITGEDNDVSRQLTTARPAPTSTGRISTMRSRSTRRFSTHWIRRSFRARRTPS